MHGAGGDTTAGIGRMRLVATRRAVGARFARDVRDGRPGTIPLVREGAIVSERYVDSLLRAGINAVYVDDELSQGIEVTPALTERTRVKAESALTHAFHDVPAAISGRRTLSPAIVDELELVAKQIATELSTADDAVLALDDLAAADAYTLQHSIDVAVLGLLLGRRLFIEHGRKSGRRRRTYAGLDDALVRLGLGLLLHDIGKLAVPKDILQKPGPLDVHEWDVIRRHPALGLDLLTTDLIGYHAKAVVRSHHERWDGLGYPDGRRGEEIAQFARIASVADVYDAVTSDRPYRPALAPALGYAEIVGGAGTAFDPQVVDVFRRVVAPYPTGSEVILSDGRRGLVSKVHPGSVHRPVVRVFTDRAGRRVEPADVSLEDHPDLDVAPPAAA
jgi:HD-GYP domain-containing protein (c-di-GMP phosphodiesterase class II)